MKKNRKSGQGMVEYIIIVAIIALAAIAIFGVFGDTIRAKLSGGVVALGGNAQQAQAATSQSSQSYLRQLGNQ